MKPLRLRMQAFGPYLGSEVIDFTRLGDRLMFLMAGDTGAGKSTVLDAICYALYDHTAGDERDAALMRSKQAPADLRTEIEFSFSVGAEHFTIVRSPAQSRPKKRGDGETSESARASLVKYDGSDEVPIASQPKKVTTAVQDILGFDAAQFRQVVVLPQGEFRRFLASGSDAREKILSRLFRTSRYANIEAALKSAADAITDKLKTSDAEITALLKAAQVENRDALAGTLNTLNSEIQTQEVELQTRQSLLTQVQAALDEGRRVNALLQRRDAARLATQAIEATGNEQRTREKNLEQARKVLAILPVYEHQQTRAKQLADATTQQHQAAEKLAATESAAEATRQQLADAERTQPELDKCVAQLAELEKLHGSVAGLEASEQALNAAKQKVASSREQLAVTEKDHQSTAHRLESVRARITELSTNPDTVELIEMEGKRIRAVIDSHRQLAVLLGSQMVLEKTIEKHHTNIEALKRDLDSGEKRLNDLEQARLDGQAVLLAQTLEPGKACPVCGALEHPAPCASKIDIPHESDITQARTGVATLRTQLQSQIAEIQHCEGQTAAGGREIESLKSVLGDACETPLSQLEQQREDLRTRHTDARQRGEDLRGLQSQLATEQLQLKKLTTDLERLRAEHSAAEQAEAAATATYSERNERLPEALRGPQELTKAIALTRSTRDNLIQGLEKARQNRQSAVAALAAAQADSTTHSKMLKTAEEQSRAATEGWMHERNSAGLVTDKAFIDANLSDIDLQQLEQRIADYRTSLEQARGVLAAAETECADLMPLELEVLETRQTEAHALWDTVNKSLTGQRLRLEQLQRLSDQIERATSGSKALDAEFRVARHLADTASGKSNSLRLSLHRYVLSVILDEVLTAATLRLLRMSGGRYRLQRRTGSGDLRSAGGLELDVFDEATGYARPVATLSGGEGFQAALSLALGLAEVTQNHAGGIHLDTLFIDEGFGSLDPEALDAAMNTLTDLNQGNRLIGIISHVPELRERIDTRLEIIKNENGSTTRWRLP